MEEALEEQQMEIESLESIYEDAVSIISGIDAAPDKEVCFKIVIKPEPEGEDEDNHVMVEMTLTLPLSYPADGVPTVALVPTKGLTEKHIPQIMEKVDETIEENTGDAMVFVLVEAAKEWLIDNNVAGLDGSEYEQMMRRQQNKQEAEDKQEKKEQREKDRLKEKAEETNPTRYGTPVTLENFTEWLGKFDAEMAEMKRANPFKANIYIPEEGVAIKLTGRQTFDRGIINLTAEDAAAAIEALEKVNDEAAKLDKEAGVEGINEDLFLDGSDDDLDLDDDEEDDDEKEGASETIFNATKIAD